MHSPSVTEAVLRNKLGPLAGSQARDSLIDSYLSLLHSGGLGHGKEAGAISNPPNKNPVARKIASGGPAGGPVGKAKVQSKEQMLERLRALADAMSSAKSCERITVDGCSFRLIKVLLNSFARFPRSLPPCLSMLLITNA